MKKISNIIFNLSKFLGIKEKKILEPCAHRFDPSEVVNLKIDPNCKKCGGKLSELTKEWYDEEKTTERMNVIGQNGNNGEHYNK